MLFALTHLMNSNIYGMLNEELYRWYRINRLDPWDFRCPYLQDCKRDNENFTTARPPLIGRRYADGSLPRLLVLSSDPGTGDPLPVNQEFSLSGRDTTEYPSKRHWSETLEIVYSIQKKFDSTLTLADASACFLHERAVKCCENNHGSREASQRLFNNCRNYIVGELPILKPDLIITQGKRASWAVKGARFHEDSSWSKCGHEEHDCRFRILTIPVHGPTLWIFTYHPTSLHKYYQANRDGYFSCYPSLALEFIENKEKFIARYGASK